MAVRQAPVFFRYAEGNRTVGYYRLHDGNFPTPHYREGFITDALYADLVLRRRQQTRLELRAELDLSSTQADQLELLTFVKNLSPLVARDVAVTVVCPHSTGELREVPDSLRPRVERWGRAGTRISVRAGRFLKNDAYAGLGVLMPFREQHLKWSVPRLGGMWKAAVICTSATSLATYWQASAEIWNNRLTAAEFIECQDAQAALVGFSDH